MTVVAIHQPEYFPWLGFLDKARRADALVLLDSVQFDRASLQHRAKVIGANGVVLLTIPFVHRFPQRIDEVALVDQRFTAKHLKTLQACYGRAPGWRTAVPRLEAIFAAAAGARRLVDVTIPSLQLLLDVFGVRTRVLRSSQLSAKGEKGDLVLAICRELGASVYLSGRSGATYLDTGAFAAAGIELRIQSYSPQKYRRLREVSGDDDRGISALDAWLNLGPDIDSLKEMTS